MKLIGFLTGFLVCILATGAPLYAQNNTDGPVEISAAKTLEWHRNDKRYVARGEAMARQGDVSVQAETLTADYREGPSSSMEIWKVVAEQNVRIKNVDSTVYGEHADYDLDKKLAVVTGSDLKMISPDQTITATERFEYWTQDNKAAAIGNAVVTRGKDTLKADRVTAMFSETKQNGQGVESIEADGHVVITTPAETLHGDRGLYKAATNTAEISGNVKIERGPNILQGERAEVNLTTNVSKIFGDPVQGGRVRGVFYPGGKKDASAPVNTIPENSLSSQ